MFVLETRNSNMEYRKRGHCWTQLASFMCRSLHIKTQTYRLYGKDAARQTKIPPDSITQGTNGYLRVLYGTLVTNKNGVFLVVFLHRPRLR